MADLREYNSVFKGRSGTFEDISNDPSVDGSDDIPCFVEVTSRRRGPNKKKNAATEESPTMLQTIPSSETVNQPVAETVIPDESRLKSRRRG